MGTKSIIQPLQSWLLNNKRCISCGKSLLDAPRKGNGIKVVTCSCQKKFIWDTHADTYMSYGYKLEN